MEAPELQTEKVTEHLHEHAHHEGSRFVSAVALSTALIAGLAAVTGALAGHHANEAMSQQIESADKWAQYQAKGIKASVLETRIVLLEAMEKPVREADREKLKDYKDKDQKEIADEAKSLEESSKRHLHKHERFAQSVTIYQLSIAIAAVSALTRRKNFWFAALGFAGLATVFLALGLA